MNQTKETHHKSPHCDGGLFACSRITGGDLSGGYFCDAFIDGKYTSMRYLYYTRREAVARFKEHLEEQASTKKYVQIFTPNK